MYWNNIFRAEKQDRCSDTRTNISNPTITGLFEDILNAGSYLRVKVTGRSMMPFLNGGEVVTLKKVAFPSLRRGDLIFFKNRHADPRLHRIVHKRRSFDGTITLLTKGDALIFLDEPVQASNVLGKVCRIEKKNSRGAPRQINMESKHWRTINAITAVGGLALSSFFHLFDGLKSDCLSLKNVSMKMDPQDK